MKITWMLYIKRPEKMGLTCKVVALIGLGLQLAEG